MASKSQKGLKVQTPSSGSIAARAKAGRGEIEIVAISVRASSGCISRIV